MAKVVFIFKCGSWYKKLKWYLTFIKRDTPISWKHHQSKALYLRNWKGCVAIFQFCRGAKRCRWRLSSAQFGPIPHPGLNAASTTSTPLKYPRCQSFMGCQWGQFFGLSYHKTGKVIHAKYSKHQIYLLASTNTKSWFKSWATYLTFHRFLVKIHSKLNWKFRIEI